MAKEGERSTAADKGKGKVDDVRDLPGGKKPLKEDKTQVNGKKKDEELKEGKLAPRGSSVYLLASSLNTPTMGPRIRH